MREPVTDGRGRKVLIIALRFPPHGGGGVQRTAYFVRYLRELGWKPHVLTGPPAERHVLDRTLTDLIPPDTPVRRTRFYDAQKVHQTFGRVHLGRVFRTFTPFLPNMNATWVPFAYRAGAEILSKERFDVVLSSAYPVSTHLVAYLLKRRFGTPWVADYRDEWSLREVMKWPSPLHRRLATRLDRLFVRAADRVVTTSPAHTLSFTRAFAPERPIETITNGFDPSDLEKARRVSVDRPDRFLVCHVGTVFTWRSPHTLLSAVADLVERGTIPANRIAIRFVGFGAPTDDLGLAEAGILQSTNYVPHLDAVAWMQAADLLLLFNTETSNIPGKTFEYLASRRPILAVCAEGPTCDVVREAKAGIVLDPDDKAGIARMLEQAYHRWEQGLAPVETEHVGLEAYTRCALTRKLHAVLEAAST